MSRKLYKPVNVIPFHLNNIGDFLGDKVYPVLHPKSKAYQDYWDKRTEECIYGKWGDDSVIKNGKKIGGYRWLPGNIDFYTKHTVILKEMPGQVAKSTERPDLRDVEWFIGYDLADCDGFAGHSDDKEFTCFRPIDKQERKEKLTNAEQKSIDQNIDHLLKKDGTFKKYIDAREYLYKTFDEPLGRPLWLNEKQNYGLISTRRLGKSSIAINAVAEYNFTFNGAKTLDEFYNQKTSTTTVVGSGNSDKTKEFFAKWNKSYDFLRTNVGSYSDGRVAESGYWWWKTEGSVAKENSFITNSVKAEGRGAGQVGPGSRLWHVSYGNSASKGAGFSCDDSIIEEGGLTDDLEAILAENAPAQKSNRKFGKTSIWGTGGDFDIIEGFKKVFHNPRAYDMLPCKNVFVSGAKDICRFIPSYYYQDFRDENGNQDIFKADEDILMERDIKEKLDTKQYLHHQASYPRVPDEIFIKYDGNEFPIKQLEKRLLELKNGAVPISTGKIAFNDAKNTEGYWIEDFDLKPLMDMDDLTDANINKEGCIIQYEAPNDDRPKRKPFDRHPMYLTFVEPVRNERGTSFLYAYTWKFNDFANPDRMQNNIAMEWFGRIDNDNEMNLKRVFEMAALYGSNIYAEVNNDAIIGVARRIKKVDWLIPWLGYVEGMEVNSRKEYEFGLYVAPGMSAGLAKLSNELLRQNVSFVEKITKEGFHREEIILAETLNSQMLVSQLIAYNEEGNYDAYDGFRLLAYWNLANKKVEPQYTDNDRDLNLLKTMRQMKASRNLRRKRAY